MKKYLIKVSLFIGLCFVIVTFTMVKHGENIDYFYNKFTTPKAKSMIIGDSRGMQGIMPSVINEKLEKSDFELPMFNYSFTIAQAPIGELYNESILKKLDKSVTNGVFIISMTPWMLASEKENNNEKGEYREAGEPPHNMWFVNTNPNYEYLLKNLNYFHFQALFKKNATMHKDGWLELDNIPEKEETFIEWKNTQSQIFDRMIEDYKISEVRLKSLDVLVKKLKAHGKVYLVRMPIDLDFLEKENNYYPGFDKALETIANSNDIRYFNFNPVTEAIEFKTYDGHHLDKNGSIVFTNILCDSILKNNSQSLKNISRVR